MNINFGKAIVAIPKSYEHHYLHDKYLGNPSFEVKDSRPLMQAVLDNFQAIAKKEPAFSDMAQKIRLEETGDKVLLIKDGEPGQPYNKSSFLTEDGVFILRTSSLLELEQNVPAEKITLFTDDDRLKESYEFFRVGNFDPTLNELA